MVEGIIVHAEFVTLLENTALDALEHRDSDDYIKVVYELFDHSVYIQF